MFGLAISRALLKATVMGAFACPLRKRLKRALISLNSFSLDFNCWLVAFKSDFVAFSSALANCDTAGAALAFGFFGLVLWDLRFFFFFFFFLCSPVLSLEAEDDNDDEEVFLTLPSLPKQHLGEGVGSGSQWLGMRWCGSGAEE